MSVDLSDIVNFHDFFLWFREMEDIENQKMRENGRLVPERSLEAVRRVLREIFGGEYSELKVNRRAKSFTINKNGTSVNFNHLSEGEKTYLTLVLDIARRISMNHPSLENPLEGDGIVLIDEIELHLHPCMQIQVIDNLKRVFLNCQFFIASNSPHVVSCVNHKENDRLISITEGKAIEISNNLYGKESDMIRTSLFKPI